MFEFYSSSGNMSFSGILSLWAIVLPVALTAVGVMVWAGSPRRNGLLCLALTWPLCLAGLALISPFILIAAIMRAAVGLGTIWVPIAETIDREIRTARLNHSTQRARLKPCNTCELLRRIADRNMADRV